MKQRSATDGSTQRHLSYTWMCCPVMYNIDFHNLRNLRNMAVLLKVSKLRIWELY